MMNGVDARYLVFICTSMPLFCYLVFLLRRTVLGLRCLSDDLLFCFSLVLSFV